MLCPECRIDNPESAAICQVCGFTLKETPLSETATPTPKTSLPHDGGSPDGTPIFDAKGRRGRGRDWAFLLGIVSALEIMSVSLWWAYTGAGQPHK